MTDRYYNDEEHCTACGRKNLLNPIRLGRKQVEWMFRLAYEWGGASDHKTMQLERTLYPTCSYPSYWDLIENYDGPGTFRLTDKGYAFLAGRIKIQSVAYMFDSRIVDYEGPDVGVADILKEDYASYAEIVAWIHANQKVAPPEVIDANVKRRITRTPRALPEAKYGATETPTRAKKRTGGASSTSSTGPTPEQRAQAQAKIKARNEAKRAAALAGT